MSTEQMVQEKLLRKLIKLSEEPQIEFRDHDTEKVAMIRKGFQVSGKVHSIELASAKKVEMTGLDFFMREVHYLKYFNSRSSEGGHTYHSYEDMSRVLGLAEEDILPIFEQLDRFSRFSKSELSKAKGVYIKRVREAASRTLVKKKINPIAI